MRVVAMSKKMWWVQFQFSALPVPQALRSMTVRASTMGLAVKRGFDSVAAGFRRKGRRPRLHDAKIMVSYMGECRETGTQAGPNQQQKENKEI